MFLEFLIYAIAFLISSATMGIVAACFFESFEKPDRESKCESCGERFPSDKPKCFPMCDCCMLAFERNED